MPDEVPMIRIHNKIDLVGLRPKSEQRSVWLSAATGEGLGLLEALVIQELGMDESVGSEFSARQRHVDQLQHALERVDHGRTELAVSGSGELLAEDLRAAAEALGEITGRVSADELLGRIFSSFCIGK
jgi:tRNA modification GTPase